MRFSAASAMPISGETREKEIPHGKPCCFRRTQDAVDMVNQYLSSVVYNIMRRQLNLPSKFRVMNAEPLLHIIAELFR